MKRQFIWVFISRTTGSLLQALLLVLLARSSEVSEFGVVNSMLGIAAFVSVIADFGVSTYIVKAYAYEVDLEKVKLALRVNARTSAWMGIGLAAIFLWWALGNNYTLWVAGLAIWVALDKNIETQMSASLALRIVSVPAISLLIRRSVPLIVYLGLILLPLNSIEAFVASLIVGTLVGQIHATRTLPTAVAKFRSHKDNNESQISVLRDSRSYAVANVSSQLRNLDVSLVGGLSGTSVGGMYAATSKISIPIFLVMSAIATIILPNVAVGGTRSARKVETFLYVSLIVFIAMALAVSPWNGWVMGLLFGKAYSSAGRLLLFIAIGTTFAAVAGPFISLLQAEGKHSIAAHISTYAAVLGFLAVAVGAVLAGAEGAAIGSLAVQVLRVSALVVALRQRTA